MDYYGKGEPSAPGAGYEGMATAAPVGGVATAAYAQPVYGAPVDTGGTQGQPQNEQYSSGYNAYQYQPPSVNQQGMNPQQSGQGSYSQFSQPSLQQPHVMHANMNYSVVQSRSTMVFDDHPVRITCPFCQHEGKTKVVYNHCTAVNWIIVLLCFYPIFCIFCDGCCNCGSIVKHRCRNCNQVVGMGDSSC